MKVTSSIKLTVSTADRNYAHLYAEVSLAPEDFPGENIQNKANEMAEKQILDLKMDLDRFEESVFKVKHVR